MNEMESPFENIEQVRVFELVAKQIRELIVTNVFSDGDKLPTEKELAGQFNVSRSSVREALRLLEAERVVVRKGDKKPFVWALTGAGQQRLVNSKEQ